MPELKLKRSELSALALEILEGGYKFRFRASGSSMQPFILDGDFLEVEPLNNKKIRTGDVLLCQVGGGNLVAHRVVGFNPTGSEIQIILQGDAGYKSNQLVLQQQVFGKIISLERECQRIDICTTRQKIFVLLWYKLVRKIKLAYWKIFPIRERLECNLSNLKVQKETK